MHTPNYLVWIIMRDEGAFVMYRKGRENRKGDAP